MRKVNRDSVIFPARLQNLTAENLAHLNNYEQISNSIYAHNDVKQSLGDLYFDKCYICECDVSDEKYDVEHYKPKKLFPHLAYEWSNLHKVCDKCNLAKEKKEFFIYNNGAVVDINLLDPSSNEYDINEYIRYNVIGLAEIVNIGNNLVVIGKARKTIEYLNGEVSSEYCKRLPFRRSTRQNNFLRFCMEELSDHKNRIREIKLNLSNYTAPLEPEKLESDQHICDKLINAEEIYLSDKSIFSSSTKTNLYPTLNITYAELVQIINKMRFELGL
ncbi:hypothetical protein LCD46_00335 [Enterobacter ludwigii]|nr:hypothetical protein [Enterobacter ludwigii]UOY70836.1 hypothetical protein LCD46_00335 [Enterobacter ludwigii]